MPPEAGAAPEAAGSPTAGEAEPAAAKLEPGVQEWGAWRVWPLRVPGPRSHQPGELDQAQKKQTFRTLVREIKKASRKGSKGSTESPASQKRKEWLEKLEQELGIYDVATVVESGDVSKRIDLVVVSAGFPKAERSSFDGLVRKLQKPSSGPSPSAPTPPS